MVFSPPSSIDHAFILNNISLEVTVFTCASIVYMYLCNLSTKLNVSPLVATNLLNHLEDFVEISLRTNILHTQQIITHTFIQIQIR